VASTEAKYLTVRQAAFIGIGAMVGAGIFAFVNMNPDLLAPSGYPPLRDIISSVWSAVGTGRLTAGGAL
jgi:hypothetical protein